MKIAKRIVGLLVVLAFLSIPAYLVGVYVTHPPSAAADIRGELTNDGSSLLGTWNGVTSTAYHQQTGVLVVPNVSSSGVGLQHVRQNLVNVGFSDVPANTPGLTSVPLLVSAIGITYHVPGLRPGKVLHLNGQILAAMYTGHIAYWDDPQIRALNPHVKLPHVAVSPMERGDSSGSTFQFLSYLNNTSDTGWPLPSMTVPWVPQPSAHVVNGSDAMLNGCKKTVGCVAYIGSPYLGQAQQKGLGIAALKNGSGQYVLPTRATIRQALATFGHNVPSNGQLPMVGALHGYPVVGFEWAIINNRQTNTKVVPAEKSYLSWLITMGTSNNYTAPVDLVPLPHFEVAIAKNLIATIK